MTPSKNLYCGMHNGTELDVDVRCHITQYSFPKPIDRNCSSVSLQPDWVEVGSAGIRQGLCLGGAPFDQVSNVLPYGDTLQLMRLRLGPSSRVVELAG